MRKFINFYRILVPIVFCFWGSCSVFGAGVIINEFMAINNTTLQDEDGDFEDWIELWNQTGTDINLNGWYLTDDQGNLNKWAFPAVTITGGTYLIIFASNKDRAVPGNELHTDFKLSGGGEYLGLVMPDGQTVAFGFAPEYPPQQADISYGLKLGVNTMELVSEPAICRAFVPTGNIGTNWLGIGFDDSSWSNGFTGVGFDTQPTYGPFISMDLDAVMRGINPSAYTRIPFVVTNVAQVVALTLHMRFDDGFAGHGFCNRASGARLDRLRHGL